MTALQRRLDVVTDLDGAESGVPRVAEQTKVRGGRVSYGVTVFLAVLAVLLAGCSGAAPSVKQHPVEPPATPTPATATPAPAIASASPAAPATATAIPEPTPSPTPLVYEAPAPRDWALIVKAPDSYVGQSYKLWTCITQFDAATGVDSFRGQASYMPESYWFGATNALFTGDGDALAEYVAGDVLSVGVDVVGSFVYDTQAGGSATVPLFRVVKVIQAQSGACR